MDSMFGIIIMFVLMVFHIVLFKYELSKFLNILDFKLPTSDDMKVFSTIGVDLVKIISDILTNKFNKIKDKLFKFKFNPVGLILSFFDYVKDDVEENSKDDVEENSKGGEGWGTFIQRNIVVTLMTLGIFIFFLYIIGGIISGVITGGILVLLTNIPLIIGSLIGIAIIIILGSILFLLFSDNTLDIIQCAEGLDASGNRRNPETLQDYEKSKMKMCKYLMNLTEPHTIIFPTIWGKKNNIKVTQVLKDQTGQIIKVILPGNVKYDVIKVETLPDEDPDNFKESGNRIIYIRASEIDKLKKNVIMFKDLKNDIYESEKIFDVFEKDYKNNIMNYYGYSNIYYLFLHPFVITMIVIFIMKLRAWMTIPSNASKGVISFVKEKSMMASIIILILKMLMVIGPIKHIGGIIGHLDYITDNKVRNQAILILFEVLTYFISGGDILSSALTNNINITGSVGGIVFLLLSCAITILVGDTIQCELEGKKTCKPSFYTEIERIKTCNEEFTNFSTNHVKNLGFTTIKEQFTEDNIKEPFTFVKKNNCETRVMPWEISISKTIKEYFISFAKIIAYQGKLKDYLGVKKVLYYFFIISIILFNITSGIGDVNSIPETVGINPISLIPEIRNIIIWFMLSYPFISFNTHSYALIENNPLSKVAIASSPYILAMIGGVLLSFGTKTIES